MGVRAQTILVGLAVCALVPGCLEPFVAHVDDATLDKALLEWRRTDHATTSEGAFGPNRAETEYTYAGAGGSPPYPGLLQIFSQRELGRRTTTELVEVLQAVVDNATEARHIRIDQAQSMTGTRTLAGGLATSFFVKEGTSTAAGLFPQDTKVRILGEAGYDAESSTAILVVAIAQVESSTQCPILGSCNRQSDMRTWIELVGDPEGSVGGATSSHGLVDHLVTHD